MLRLAVISDLHCHPPQPLHPRQSSWLQAGATREIWTNHPVEALRHLVSSAGITADVLLCPGDICDQASAVGLDFGWHVIHEVKHVLGARRVLATLGNHDVDSRGASAPDAMALPRACRTLFPHRDDLNRSFWTKGFFLTEFVFSRKRRAAALLLNTVLRHTDKITAQRGVFDEASLAELRTHLSGIRRAHTIRFAVMHHHPVLHARAGTTSTDVVESGDALMQVLRTAGFRFVVHGHRHHPRVTRVDPTLHVIAAGSFGAILGADFSNTRNTFQLIEYDPVAPSDLTLRTWEFNFGTGWVPASSQSAGIPPTLWLGPQPPPNLAALVNDAVAAAPNPEFVPWQQLQGTAPALRYLLPDEHHALASSLQGSHAIRIVYDDRGMPVGAGRAA